MLCMFWEVHPITTGPWKTVQSLAGVFQGSQVVTQIFLPGIELGILVVLPNASVIVLYVACFVLYRKTLWRCWRKKFPLYSNWSYCSKNSWLWSCQVNEKLEIHILNKPQLHCHERHNRFCVSRERERKRDFSLLPLGDTFMKEATFLTGHYFWLATFHSLDLCDRQVPISCLLTAGRQWNSKISLILIVMPFLYICVLLLSVLSEKFNKPSTILNKPFNKTIHYVFSHCIQ